MLHYLKRRSSYGKEIAASVVQAQKVLPSSCRRPRRDWGSSQSRLSFGVSIDDEFNPDYYSDPNEPMFKKKQN